MLPLDVAVCGVFFVVYLISAALTTTFEVAGTLTAYLPHIYVIGCLFLILPFRSGLLVSLFRSPVVSFYIFYCVFVLIVYGVQDSWLMLRSLIYLMFLAFLAIFSIRSVDDNTTDAQKLRSFFDILLFGLVIFCVVWLVMADPSIGETGVTRYTTSTFSSNAAGRFALFGAIIATISVFKRNYDSVRAWLYYCAVVVCLLVLTVGLNKTSLVTYAIFLLFYSWQRDMLTSRSVLLGGAVMSVAVLYMGLGGVIVDLFSDDRNLNNIMELSGRLLFWPIIIDLISSDALRLMFGFGYGSADMVLTADLFWTDVGHAHNALLNSVLETGIIGAVLLHILLLNACVKSFKASRDVTGLQGHHYIFFWLLIAILFRGITEGGYGQIGSIDAMLVIIAYVFYSSLSLVKKTGAHINWG